MSTPWFFLSYANIDTEPDSHVAEFYSDLVRELRVITQLPIKTTPNSDLGFLDRENLDHGTIWPEELAAALRKCRVLVCLYSDGYFKSAACGREFTIFKSRMDAWLKEDETRKPPRLIMPIPWVVRENFFNSLPPAVKDISIKKNEVYDEVVGLGGLYYVKTGRPKLYRKYVCFLAAEICEAAEPSVLPQLDRITPFHQVEPAFGERLAHGTPQSESSLYGAPLPRLPPKLLYIAVSVIVGLVLLAGLLYLRPRPTDNRDPQPTPKPTSKATRAPLPPTYKDSWSDLFQRKKERDKYIWIQEAEWDYPAGQWLLVNGIDGIDEDGALMVKGQTPGVVKDKIFGNFEARFTISFKSGGKAGWLLRASKTPAGDYNGYHFVLEKPVSEGQLFYLNARGVGETEHKISPLFCQIDITEYGKPGDYIDVVVTAIDNKFFYTFTLMNPDPNDERMVKLNQPGCIIEDQAAEIIRQGYIGFFAYDEATQFKIEKLAVEPK